MYPEVQCSVVAEDAAVEIGSVIVVYEVVAHLHVVALGVQVDGSGVHERMVLPLFHVGICVEEVIVFHDAGVDHLFGTGPPCANSDTAISVIFKGVVGDVYVLACGAYAEGVVDGEPHVGERVVCDAGVGRACGIDAVAVAVLKFA